MILLCMGLLPSETGILFDILLKDCSHLSPWAWSIVPKICWSDRCGVWLGNDGHWGNWNIPWAEGSDSDHFLYWRMYRDLQRLCWEICIVKGKDRDGGQKCKVRSRCRPEVNQWLSLKNKWILYSLNILLNLFLLAPSSLVVCVYGNVTKERGMVCNADSGGPLIVKENGRLVIE